MLKRHASGVLSVLRAEIAANDEQLAKGEVPADRLIALILPGARTPSPPAAAGAEPPSETTTLVLTGRYDSSGRNIVRYGGREAGLADREFCALLRLVVGVFEEPGGLIPRLKLESEAALAGGPPPVNLTDQGRHSLRAALAPLLPAGDADLVQVVRGRGVRLNIEGRAILWDEGMLSSHGEAIVRRLAARLPSGLAHADAGSTSPLCIGR
jgi:hypothetical protein